MDSPLARRIFRLLNRFFMVPLFRLGLGKLFGTPFGGYVMVMKMTGWKSGQTRFVPVNYAIAEGDVYCLSGYGKDAHWYRNLMANPEIELLLPGRRVKGSVGDASEDPRALELLRQILKNSGFASFMAGLNPFSINDERLADFTKNYRLLRFRGDYIAAGEADPGGRLWLIWILLALLLFVLLFS